MRTARYPTLRILLIALATATAAPLFAQEVAQGPAASEPLIRVDRVVLYALVALAVVQVIFILAMSGIMRTLGGSGAVAQWLSKRGGRLIILAPFLFAWSTAGAQAYKGASTSMELDTIFWILVGVNVFLFIIMLAQISVLRGMTRALVGGDGPEGMPAEQGPSWADRLLKRLTRRVEVEQEKDILMHHEYDGIRELDNVLPPWWLWLFYGTIIWSVVYLVNVHIINIWPDQATEYADEMAQAKADVAAYNATLTNTVDENTVTASTDPAVLASGKSLFTQYCTPCHGADAAGSETSVGPNLTDAHWLHGGGAKNIFRTIKNGVPEKGMISWKAQLKPAEMAALASYIISLEGTGPSTQKAPQGEIWKEDAAPAEGGGTVPDSTVAQADSVRLAANR